MEQLYGWNEVRQTFKHAVFYRERKASVILKQSHELKDKDPNST